MWRPDYITLDELKDLVHVDEEDTADDVLLASIPSAASRAVDRCCHRQFGIMPIPSARTYPVRYNRRTGRWHAEIDDLMTETGLILPEAVGTDYWLEPENAADEGKPWESISFGVDPVEDREGRVRITALWGWTSVPEAVKLATLLQANRWASRKNSPYGIAGSPDQGSELRLLQRVDPDVVVSLRDYRRDWWAA